GGGGGRSVLAGARELAEITLPEVGAEGAEVAFAKTQVGQDVGAAATCEGKEKGKRKKEKGEREPASCPHVPSSFFLLLFPFAFCHDGGLGWTCPAGRRSRT